MIISTQERGLICENLTRSTDGELCLGGVGLSYLAKKYGTPLYIYDEDRIRERIRAYTEAVRSAFGERGRVLYASKAASFLRLYEIVKEEGIGIDVVSSGEICIASASGFPMHMSYFHSNNKTDSDIEYAISKGVGYFVVDNAEELYAIDRIAREKNVRQNILLRITPGIDPHTYAAVATGKVDSKFGSAIETGQADKIVEEALSLSGIRLRGFHCHIGSQVFDSDVYISACKVMLTFVADIYEKYGFLADELDIGGGIGVRYVESQPTPDIRGIIAQVGDCLTSLAQQLGIALPTICFEPGRSIVADAGATVYTVGTVKRIPGYKNYVSVDGGMTDNPRFALYGSPYTILPVMRRVGDDPMSASVVGRCCESGDILQENVPLPADISRGELLACLTTGAYHYSMSSNYNRIPRPPIVMLRGGEDYLAVRRETPEDLMRLDILL